MMTFNDTGLDRHDALEGLEALVSGCEFVKRYQEDPSDSNKQAINSWLKSSLGKISTMDIESFNGVELCELALSVDKENPKADPLQRLVFTYSAAAVVVLGEKVRDSENGYARDLLLSVAQNEVETNSALNACRIIATLVYSGVIEKKEIPADIAPSVSSLENGINLLHRISKNESADLLKTIVNKVKSWPVTQAGKQFIEFKPRVGVSRDIATLENLANQVITDGSAFEETLKVIYSSLTDQNTSIEDRIDSYTKLLMLQGRILDSLQKSDLEHVLPIILSTPGLMEDLYGELGRIEVFSDNDFGLCIRAGLKSPWYRDQCVEALVHAGVFGVETSDLRVQMFEALKGGEILAEEILAIAQRRYGSASADRLWRNIEDMESHLGASGATPLDFKRRERKPIEWIIKPSIDRVYDTAVKGLKDTLGYADSWPGLDEHAQKFRERIIGNLEPLSYQDMFFWARSLGWHMDARGEYQEKFNCLQALYIQHSLIRYGMPIATRSVSNSVLRGKMADILAAREYREPHPIKDAKVDARALSLFHSISTGNQTHYDEIVINLGIAKLSQSQAEGKKLNADDLFDHLHGSILKHNKDTFDRFLIPLTDINTQQLAITLSEENKLSVVASGRTVSRVEKKNLRDEKGIEYSNGTKRARYEYEQAAALVDIDSGEVVLDSKTLKGNFYTCVRDTNFCYHSAPQDSYSLGDFYPGDCISTPFGLFFGGTDYYQDLIYVFELGSQFSQSALYKTTHAAEKAFSKEPRDTENITYRFTITHLFDLQNGDRYAICKNKNSDKYYLMPLKVSGLQLN